MSVIRTADWANAENPFWIDAITGLATTPNIQVSTLQVNNTGRIVLEADPVVPNQNAVIAFTSPTTTTGLLGYSGNTQVSATGIVSQKYQITSLDSTGLAYDDLASDSLVLYGNNVVGGLPIASFKEYLNLNYLNIISPGVVTQNMYLSTLNVSSVNGLPYPPNGSNSNAGSNFQYLFARVADISSLTVSSLSGFSGGIQASSITTQVMLASTLAFQPSLGGLSPKIDLGMGGFLGGIAGSIGSGIFNTILGGAALATGVAGLMMPRGVAPGGNSTNLNSNNFELINGTTQLQVSTLGAPQNSILRFVSSVAPNVPGREIFISTIIPAGSVAIRSMSDPLNLANPAIQTSSIMSFGQWTLMPFLSNNTSSNTFEELTVSSINNVDWDDIQYWNMASVNQGTFVVVNDANKYLYIGATLTGYPPPGSNPQYEYYSVELETGPYTYQGFVDMVNAVLGQEGGPGQIEFAIDPVSHIINIQNVNLNISPLTQVYTLIWNPSTGAPFASSNFSPAWTSNAITASSQLFGAGLSNVNQSPNPPSPLVFLPNPVPIASYVGPVAFGPYLQVSTINSASTITGPGISTININLTTINGQPYVPSTSCNITAIVSSLTVSSINTVSWDTIQYWNVAPTYDGNVLNVVTGSNDVVFIGVSSASTPSINSNIAITVPPGSYTIHDYCVFFRTAINSAPSNFHRLYPDPFSNTGRLGYANLWGSGSDRTYQIYFNTANIGLFPTYSAARMTAVGVLQGATVNSNVIITTDPNLAVLPNVAGTPVYTTYPFSSDIQMSTLTVSQAITTDSVNTSFINGTNWATIEYANQAPTYNSNDRAYIVTTSNNILCMSAIANSPPGSTYSNIYGLLLPVGTYSTGQFITTVNNTIQAYSATTSNEAFRNLFYNINSSNRGTFINTSNAIPPPVATTFYKLDFNPANYALYSNADYNLMIGSAQLFGSGTPIVYTINPTVQITFPLANYTPLPTAPEPFGPDLQVSSLTIAGQGLILGVPTGSITMYAGYNIPSGYLRCDGSYYPVSQYFNLYNALSQGLIYGVDSSNITFAVPNLQATFPMGAYYNTSPVPITISRPSGPGSNGSILLLKTNSPNVITNPLLGPNLITPDMWIYYGSNQYNVNQVLWSGPSTIPPYNIFYVINIGIPIIPYDGASNIPGYAQVLPGGSFGFPYSMGGESTNVAYNIPLNSSNMAPHTHASYVGKGGTNGAVDTTAVNATGFPNITYGQQPTTDGTTYFNNRAVPNSLPVGQVTPGLGFDLTPFGFSNNTSSFSVYNNNVTIPPALPPYTVVNYIIKY